MPKREPFVSGRAIRQAERTEEEEKQKRAEEEGVDTEARKYALFGVDRDSKANKSVDLNAVYSRVKKLEDYAKFWVKSRGVPTIEPFDPPDDFFHKNEGTRVITPAVCKTYEEATEKINITIQQRKGTFEERAFSAIEKVLELRNKHWGVQHPMTLSSHLVHLSMLEVQEVWEELHERLMFWLLTTETILYRLEGKVQATQDDFLEPDEAKELEYYNKELHFYLNFYGCIARMLSDCLVEMGRVEESAELTQNAMKIISRFPKECFVHVILVGRCLTNAYLELGKVDKAMTVLELLLDLQSDNTTPQQYTRRISIDEWVDPIRERINTTIQLARLKMTMAQYEECESLLRTALSLAVEQAGKFTSLACNVQMELLTLLHTDPNRSEKEFLELFLLSLDVAKRTHELMMKDIDGTEDHLTKKSMAQSLPYATLLRQGVALYQHSPKHKALYLDLLFDLARAWAEEEITESSTEFCTFALSAVNKFIEEGMPERAIKVLALADPFFNTTYWDPSPEVALFIDTQAKASLAQCFGERVNALPYDIRGRTPDDDPQQLEQSMQIAYRTLDGGLDILRRANNNELPPLQSSVVLSTFADTMALHGRLEQAQSTCQKALRLLLPSLQRTSTGLQADLQGHSWDSLQSARYCLTLSGAIAAEEGQYQAAIHSLEFACRVIMTKPKRELPASQQEAALLLLEESASQLTHLERTLEKLVRVQTRFIQTPEVQDDIDALRKQVELLDKYQEKQKRVQAQRVKCTQELESHSTLQQAIYFPKRKEARKLLGKPLEFVTQIGGPDEEEERTPPREAFPLTPKPPVDVTFQTPGFHSEPEMHKKE